MIGNLSIYSGGPPKYSPMPRGSDLSSQKPERARLIMNDTQLEETIRTGRAKGVLEAAKAITGEERVALLRLKKIMIDAPSRAEDVQMNIDQLEVTKKLLGH